MTMFEWHAKLVEDSANFTAFWIEKTRNDKVGWAPTIDGSTNTRSALQLGAECAMVNRTMAGLLRGEDGKQEQPEYTATEECTADLRASAKELADAVRGMDEAALTKLYDSPFGPMPGSFLMQIALLNMNYHGGQVNLIQLLYGDPKFYVPGRD
jgi:hypothetical protein